MPRDLEGGKFTAGKPGGLPFVEAIDYARSREVELAADYYGNAIKEHRAKATTITGAASVDQIQAVMDRLRDTIADGGTFDEWKKTAVVQGLGLPEHRLDNIFRTNVQAAYNRGRYQQQVASKTRPMWMYDAVNDSRVRPSHLAMDTVILPRDDPWWTTHYPPNGYRCRCVVLALSEKQATARGGVTKEVPADATPDPGWDYNPGADYRAPDAKILTPAPDASTREAQALADTKAAADRKNLSYADLYQLGSDSLRRDMATAGGHWTEGFAPVLTDAQSFRVLDLFMEKVQAAAAGPKHVFTVKATRAGIAPKKLVEPVQRFFAMLPQAWQKLVADSLRSTPLTVEDGLKANGKHKRGEFNPNTMHLRSAHNEPHTINHEAAHALQKIAPDLDDFFQAHHRERTAGDPLESLLARHPKSKYAAWEVTRPDKYFSDYVGKEYLPRSQEADSVWAINNKRDTANYKGAALELMSMTFEAAFSGESRFLDLIQRDPRLLAVLYGLLFHY